MSRIFRAMCIASFLFGMAILAPSASAQTANNDAKPNDVVWEGIHIQRNGWISNGGDDTTWLFYRLPVIRPSAGFPRVWERAEFVRYDPTINPNDLSTLFLTEVDCVQGRSHVIQTTAYAGNNQTGAVVVTDTQPDAWEYPPPRTYADAILKIACSATPGDPTAVPAPIKRRKEAEAADTPHAFQGNIATWNGLPPLPPGSTHFKTATNATHCNAADAANHWGSFWATGPICQRWLTMVVALSKQGPTPMQVHSYRVGECWRRAGMRVAPDQLVAAGHACEDMVNQLEYEQNKEGAAAVAAEAARP